MRLAGGSMNLIVGTMWLLAGVGLLGYEYGTGQVVFPIRSLNISMGWLLLVLALYNFARWFQSRSKQKSKTQGFIREARIRQAQRRERPEPDPTFDFSQPSPAAFRPPLDQPPSNN